MGKTIDIFKKNQRYQRNISCKDGLDKGQKWYGPNRSRRYLEEVARIHSRTYKKDLHDRDNHDDVITHLEPDILKCKIKWALGRITMNKASGGDGIPVELFLILKDAVCKSVVLNMPANLENSALATGLEKVSFHFNPQESQCQRIHKLLHNCIHLTRQ